MGRRPGRGKAPTALPRHAERPFYNRQSEKRRLDIQAERKRPQPPTPPVDARPRPLSPARLLLAVQRPGAAGTAPARARPLPCPAFRPGGCDWLGAPPEAGGPRPRALNASAACWDGFDFGSLRPGRRRAGRIREVLCGSGLPSRCSRGGAAASGPSDLRARGTGRSEPGSDWGRAGLGPSAALGPRPPRLRLGRGRSGRFA